MSPLPAELDTGEDWLKIPLAPIRSPFMVNDEARTLSIRRETSGHGRVLRILDKTISGSGTHQSWACLSLRQDVALPLYARSELERFSWDFDIRYLGRDQVKYAFQTREGAFRFQQYITGYEVVEIFDDVACTFNYRDGGLRRSQYSGRGQIQVWRHERQTRDRNNDISPVSSTRSRSTHRNSVSSLPGRASLVQKYQEATVLVIEESPPPLLVAFLEDKNRDGYTMLKISLLDFKQRDNGDGENSLILEPLSNASFPIDMHLSPANSTQNSWNLCEWNLNATDKSTVKRLQCKEPGFSLSFGSKAPENIVARKRLGDSIQKQRLIHRIQQRELQSAGRAQVAQISRDMRTPPSSGPPSIISFGSSVVEESFSPRKLVAERPPVLPGHEPLESISLEFFEASRESPSFGRAGITAELESHAVTR